MRRVGLGNNGGSLTLIKSGNALVDMGHDVYFVDGGSNQHTWAKLNAEHIVVKRNNKIPDADVIIATGYKSVATTVSAPSRCGLKAHYIRGWETWQMPEKKIVKSILSAPTLKIVNSLCLKDKLKFYNIDSFIIRPGYDFEDLFPMNCRNRKNKNFTVIGGLYTKGKHEKIKRTSWIFNTYDYLKKKHKVKLWMFGNEPIPNKMVDEYFLSPSKVYKNSFYNSVDIWLAPAMQEGLHMPPAEAMLTECPVVATSAPMSGTQDYMLHKSTGLVSDDNINSFIKCAEKLCIDIEERKQMGKNARERILNIGSRKQNMQKLVDYILEKTS